MDFMNRKFSGQLDAYLRQAGLPLRRVASQSGIPHQTIFNWLKGSQPRWHAALPGDLHRLGKTLGLADEEITHLLRLAGCIAERSGFIDGQETPMKYTFRIPKGWDASGDVPGKYEMGLDPSVTYENCPCATIKAGPDPSEFAALCQTFKADAYRGKRLRLSGYIQSKDITQWAGMWLRIDGPKGEPLGFDNMEKRPIKGTADWNKYEIVLDVPENAKELAFGLMLTGSGQIWMAALNFEAVGKEVASTSTMSSPGVQSAPTNLSFDK